MASNRKVGLQKVRAWNRRLVLQTIRSAGEISRYDIAKCTGLDPATVSKLTNDLLKSKYIRKTGIGKSSGGRRPILLSIDGKSRFFLSVELLPHSIVASIFNFEFDQVETKSITCRGKLDGGQLTEMLHSAVSIIGERSLIGVAIGVDGVIDADAGTILRSAALNCRDYPIRDVLHSALNVPATLCRRANALAWAEYESLEEESRNMAAFYAGRGVGAALILDGRIYRGSHGFAGEIGHASLRDSGPACEMGHVGCLESLVCTGTILRELSSALGRDIDLAQMPAVYDESSIARRILDTKAGLIAEALTMILDLFDPGALILGGELLGSSELLFHLVSEELANRSYAMNNERSPKVVPSSLRPELVASSLVRLHWHDLEEEENQQW